MTSLPNTDDRRASVRGIASDELETTRLHSDALVKAIGAVATVEDQIKATEDEQRRRNLGHQLIAAHAHLKRLRDALTRG
jgi:hypothetical protein